MCLDTGAKQVHHNASYQRHTAEKVIKFIRETIRQIIEKTKEKWSPEQTSGRLRQIQIYMSHERIYQFLLENERKGGKLF